MKFKNTALIRFPMENFLKVKQFSLFSMGLPKHKFKLHIFVSKMQLQFK